MQCINRHGDPVTDEEAHDEKGTLRDGYGYRHPIILADAAPRFFMKDSAPDAQRDRLLSAYEARDARLTSAWKDAPPPVAKTADRPAPSSDPIAAYEARDARLRAAWQHPV
ncbi:MAG: hypothetical protein WBH00_12175 [Xanthobacteraceae bacterium]